MPRSGRLRRYIQEFTGSSGAEKISFIPPFLVLIVEIILIQHAIRIQVDYVIELTIILLILSVIEIILVSREMHKHYQRRNFDRILTIRLDDFIIEKKKKNVKELVEEFIEKYPHYSIYRNEIYHTTCQIMETHEEETWEKTLDDKLKKFIRRKKKMNVDEILEAFIKKYPKYRKRPSKVYHAACQIMAVPKEKKEDI